MLVLSFRRWLCIRLDNAGKWACDRLTEDADFGKKNYIFSSFWSWRVYKQAKLSHLGHRKPAPIHWKADARKTSHCLMRIKPFFFENEQGETVTVNDDRYRAMLNEFLFKKLKRRILTAFGFNRTGLHATHPKLHSHYQPQSWCRLATSQLRFDTAGLLFEGCRQR